MNVILELDNFRSDVLSFLNADQSPFYRQVGKILLNATYKNFDAEGAYFDRGNFWTPLADSTIKRRGSADNILRPPTSGVKMWSTINYTATNDGVEIGTNLAYAKYLHFGTKYMPARPIFPENELPPEVLEDIVDAYTRFVNRLMN